MEIQSHRTEAEALRALTDMLALSVRNKAHGPFNLALSGGATAAKLFRFWTDPLETHPNWRTVRFFWVDERCVAPQDSQSNYGEAQRLFFGPMGIPSDRIFRIRGEIDPGEAAREYTARVADEVPAAGGIPCFDAIILGVGEDMHTASIFPGESSLLTAPAGYAVSEHPLSGQRRVTMTGQLILAGRLLLVPVVGRGKAPVTERLVDPASGDRYPATYLLSRSPQSVLLTDVL